MSGSFLHITGIVPMTAVDRQFLSGVKTGFGSSGVTVGWSEILPIIAFLVLVILVLLILRKVIKPKELKLGGGDITETVSDPEEVLEIINRSVTLRARYDTEIDDKAYREIYKGQVLAVHPDGLIEVELGKFTDISLDFVNRPATVSFRMSRLGEQEFYQFDTVTKGLSIARVDGRKERAVRMLIPDKLSIGQKRRHLRLEPAGAYRFKVQILNPTLYSEPMPMASFQKLHETDVVDISLGGIRVVIRSLPGDIQVSPGQETFLYFKLPATDLDDPEIPDAYCIRANVISIERQQTGRRVFSRAMDERTVGPHIIRMNFTGIGRINKKDRNVSFRAASPLSFEGIARWIQACQRRQIQFEKGTLRRPDRPQNLYPRKNWEIDPKYPSQPPKK